MPPPLWLCPCHQPSFFLSLTDKTDNWNGTEREWGVMWRTLVILSSKKSCTFTWCHWAVWEGGIRGCSGCWGVEKAAALTCLCTLTPQVSAGFGGQPGAVGQTGVQVPARAWGASPCHRERVPGGALRWGCSSNAYGCPQGPDAFLLCQERNFPSTFQSSLPILHSLSFSFSVYICSIQHFQELCVRLFSVHASK